MPFTRFVLIIFIGGTIFSCQSNPENKDVATSSMERDENSERSQDPDSSASDKLPILPSLGLGNPKPLPKAVEGFERLTWDILRDVSFEDKYYEKEDEYFLFPTYGDEVASYEGEEVYLSGYLLPINPDSNVYVLSANTFSSCYFCGNAGPESIVELDLVDELGEGYLTDQWVAFKGKLGLNADNLDHLYYILKEAEEVPLKE